MRIDYHNGSIHGIYFSHSIDVPIDESGELHIIQEMHNAEHGGISRQLIFIGWTPMIVEIAMDYQPRDWKNGRFRPRVHVGV